MFYHFFTGESNYSKAFLELLEEIADIKEHCIVFGLARRQDKRIQYSQQLTSQIKYLTKPKDLFYILNSVKKADWIYLHYLAYDPSLFYWAGNLRLLEKTTWVVWGNDIYSYYKRNKNLKTRIYELLRRRIIPHFPEIAAFVEEDVDLIRNLYTSNAVYTQILYPIPVNTSHLKKYTKQKEGNEVVFLTGNSGDPSNLHFEMLDYLSRFRNENIRVKCPLSYGGSALYRQNVISYGRQIFGDNFQPVTQFMNADEYAQLLVTVDVALMNHKRQQGLGNILALMYLGRKVFMRSEISSFYFFKRQDIEVCDIEMLSTGSFEDIVKPVKNRDQMVSHVTQLLDRQTYRRYWNDLLSKHFK